MWVTCCHPPTPSLRHASSPKERAANFVLFWLRTPPPCPLPGGGGKESTPSLRHASSPTCGRMQAVQRRGWQVSCFSGCAHHPPAPSLRHASSPTCGRTQAVQWRGWQVSCFSGCAHHPPAPSLRHASSPGRGWKRECPQPPTRKQSYLRQDASSPKERVRLRGDSNHIGCHFWNARRTSPTVGVGPYLSLEPIVVISCLLNNSLLINV